MIRPTLSLVLITVLLANQAAELSCGHVHAGESTSQHSARTHFHLSGDAHHDHVTCPPHSHAQTEGEFAFASSVETSCPVDHDDDACYFVAGDDVYLSSSRELIDLSSLSAALSTASQSQVERSRGRIQRSLSVPLAGHRCAIFLKNRRLLL